MYVERIMIETWYNYDYNSKKEMIKLLHKVEQIIINREKIIMHWYEWTEEGYNM